MITMVGAELGEGPHPRKGTHYGRNRGRGRTRGREHTAVGMLMMMTFFFFGNRVLPLACSLSQATLPPPQAKVAPWSVPEGRGQQVVPVLLAEAGPATGDPTRKGHGRAETGTDVRVRSSRGVLDELGRRQDRRRVASAECVKQPTNLLSLAQTVTVELLDLVEGSSHHDGGL